MPDYYTILGVDRDASPESVKAAFRRLARQHHPDLQAECETEAQKALVHAHMAQLNDAYATLSSPKSRREYDERLRLEYVLVSKSAGPAEGEARTEHAQTAASKTHHARMQPQHDSDTTVITQMAGHLRQKLTGKKFGFSWSPVALEGFDWGLEAVTWSACHCVALRGFPIIDPLRVKKFINYSEMAVAFCKRPIRKNHFLFLLPFIEMSEWESVARQIQSFLGGKGRTGGAPGLPPTGVILLDVHHGRTLRLGSRFSDKRFEKLIQSMGPRP